MRGWISKMVGCLRCLGSVVDLTDPTNSDRHYRLKTEPITDNETDNEDNKECHVVVLDKQDTNTDMSTNDAEIHWRLEDDDILPNLDAWERYYVPPAP